MALAYLNGLKNEDLDSMLKTFAIESFVENYDFETSLKRSGGYTSRMNLPNSNEFVKRLNIERIKILVTENIIDQYLYLCGFDKNQSLPLEDEIEVNEFTTQVNELLKSPNLHELKILGFIPPEETDDMFSSEAYLNNNTKMATSYGAQQVEDCFVVFELGNYYLLILKSVSYNDKWYIFYLGGIYGTSNTGGLTEIPPELFNEISPYIVPVE